MEKNTVELKVGEGVVVVALLVNAHKPTPSGAYHFKGDLCQMAEAARVARKLGIEVGIGGGLPYVLREEEYDKVVQYIVDNHVEGYWHYAK